MKKKSKVVLGLEYQHRPVELRYGALSISLPPIVTTLGLTIMILSFRTDRSGQMVQTQIRLLLEEQSDQRLHCLLFHLHLFDKLP